MIVYRPFYEADSYSEQVRNIQVVPITKEQHCLPFACFKNSGTIFSTSSALSYKNGQVASNAAVFIEEEFDQPPSACYAEAKNKTNTTSYKKMMMSMKQKETKYMQHIPLSVGKKRKIEKICLTFQNESQYMHIP